MMLKVTNHHRSAHPNHNERESYTCHNGYYQKYHKQQMLVRKWRKEDSCTWLVGMQIGAATTENSMVVPQKIKNRTII